MKIVFVLCLLFFSCNQKEYSEKVDIFEQTIKNEINSGVRNDTIFLGFTFGMTENEVVNKLKQLTTEGKILINKNNIYQYNFVFANKCLATNAQAEFSVDYFENKLYKFIISVKSNDYLGIPQNLLNCIFLLYMNKYSVRNLFERQSVIYNECKNYIWVNGNQKTEIIAGFNDVRIIYTDLIAEEKLRLHTKSLNDSVYKNLIDDL